MNNLVSIVINVLSFIGSKTESCSAWGFYSLEKPNIKN